MKAFLLLIVAGFMLNSHAMENRKDTYQGNFYTPEENAAICKHLKALVDGFDVKNITASGIVNHLVQKDNPNVRFNLIAQSAGSADLSRVIYLIKAVSGPDRPDYSHELYAKYSSQQELLDLIQRCQHCTSQDAKQLEQILTPMALHARMKELQNGYRATNNKAEVFRELQELQQKLKTN